MLCFFACLVTLYKNKKIQKITYFNGWKTKFNKKYNF